MNGKIVKGIAGFYYVSVAGSGIYECKAKGIFRKEGRKPLVGDDVAIEVLDQEKMEANLVDIFPRKNELIRPAVANVDQALIIFAMESPAPNAALLDRFLVMMEYQEIPAVICFNKMDLVSVKEQEYWQKIYESCGYRVIFTCARKKQGLEGVRIILKGKTTVAAGPSGVGKSTITNAMQDDVFMETGEVSKKLKRGRNTTRHSQLIPAGENTFLCDTPGFTSLFMPEMVSEDLRFCYPEMIPLEGKCRYQGCIHKNEPDCAVKEAVAAGKIPRERYDNYIMFYEELKEKERRRY